jgi:tetratricopeptide (TPR) repeat protein
VLEQKAGDCDDLTALYCALLESAGVATALVDYPGHIFMLFDSGIKRQQAYQLPLTAKQYVVWGDRLWIPVEVTLLHQSFQAAWKAGLEKMAGLEPGHVVETAVAWQDFAPAEVSFEGEGVTPSRAAFEERVVSQHEAVQEQIDSYVEATYLAPLAQEPENGALRAELARVYLGLRQYEAVIAEAYAYLNGGGENKALAYNQLGIASHMKGDLDQAEHFFRVAEELVPEDEGVKRNLGLVLAGQGKGVRKATVTVEVAGGGKAAEEQVDAEGFYWME